MNKSIIKDSDIYYEVQVLATIGDGDFTTWIPINSNEGVPMKIESYDRAILAYSRVCTNYPDLDIRLVQISREVKCRDQRLSKVE